MVHLIARFAGRSVIWACAVGAMHAQPAPHASHGPRSGGAFATAATDTLHLELSWAEQRRARLFVVDATGAPIALEKLRDFEIGVVAGGRESPFVLLEVEGYFEARIPTLTLPATMALRLRPDTSAEAELLTFSFSDYSAAVYGSTAPAEIPPTPAAILDAMADEWRTMEALIDRGAFLELLGPEDRIRELVLALEPHLEARPPSERIRAQSAITATVRAGWLLHTALDYGSGAQRTAAIADLDHALREVAAAVGGGQ